ncbi:cell wall protein [Streptomyces sp. NPDC018610]|uniref:cell wall protein n=1 Tax=Streptomyces sp. NPDC018610 TaxID=3365049 RepID=UPI003792EDEC
MSTARRTLLTATAAGTLLGALWFVPSASATGETPTRAAAGAAAHVAEQGQHGQRALSSSGGSATTAGYRATAASQDTVESRTEAQDGAQAAPVPADGTRLADTGSLDTTPYVVGGTLFLVLGAGFVVYSVRRERLGV